MSDRTSDVERHGLNYVMDFEYVIRVDAEGRVFDMYGDHVYAPNLYDDELDDPAWEFFSEGYTGQYGYNGPIMHNSEFIGGRLADDILSTPGIYAAVVAYWDNQDYKNEGGYSEGWAVVRLKAS